jgi:DNA-binding NtrC family response regulator
MDKTKILVIDDDQETLDLLDYYLTSKGYAVTTANTGEQALALAEGNRFNLVLTDLRLPDVDGIEVVERLKKTSLEIEIIMISGQGSVSDAVDATKAGAFYFVQKPIELDELTVLIEKALERSQQAQEIERLRGRLANRTSYYDIIGGSKAMQNIYEMIDSVAETDANILIVGESGTGKELIANAIHYKSQRSRKAFVKINCSALPKELIESELFGHTKGAFTGAGTERSGLLARADGGSLLLDEISEMPMELQPKLLRVLQDRVYYRLGSEKAQEVNFRLISATNRDPLAAVREGFLREDLYYRINTIEIHVPPLRDRIEDIQHLSEHFLQVFAEKYHRSVRAISQHSYQRLFEYSWPGNVRELQHLLERAVLLCKGDTLEIETVAPPQVARAAAASSNGSTPVVAGIAPPAASQIDIPRPPSSVMDKDDLTLDEIGRIIIDGVPDPQNGKPPVHVFEQVERAIVSAALARTKGNKQAAANLLGVYRPRLYSLIKKHKIGNG